MNSPGSIRVSRVDLEKLWDALSAQYGLSEHALAYYLLSEVEALFANRYEDNQE